MWCCRERSKLIAAAGLAAVLFLSAAHAADSVHVSGWWPAQLPEDPWFPVAVLELPNGQLVVADRSLSRLFQLPGPDGPIRRLAAPGRRVIEWTALSNAVGLSFLALDGPGRVIHQYDLAGNYLGIAVDLQVVADDENLGPIDPAGLAMDASGQAVVSDRMGDRLLVFAPGWNLVGVWGETGDARGQWRRPGAVAVGRRTRFLVADEGNRRVVLLDDLGTVSAVRAFENVPRGCAVWGEGYAVTLDADVVLLDADLIETARIPLPRSECQDEPFATSALTGGRQRLFVGEGCSGRLAVVQGKDRP